MLSNIDNYCCYKTEKHIYSNIFKFKDIIVILYISKCDFNVSAACNKALSYSP